MVMKVIHDPRTLMTLFDDLFYPLYQTRLMLGGDEPVYLPADGVYDYHRVVFAHGFYASALHEIAHWCIAGVRRRQLIDYGYWYKPDGRSLDEQLLFEEVEFKPQALEWIFSKASVFQFRVSADNLKGEPQDLSYFKERIYRQVIEYIDAGLPERASQFVDVLAAYYNVDNALAVSAYSMSEL
jgi:elongation factor P hydroxylase